MDYILRVVIIVSVFILCIRIYRIVASYIGEQLGIGKFFINLWKKIRRYK